MKVRDLLSEESIDQTSIDNMAKMIIAKCRPYIDEIGLTFSLDDNLGLIRSEGQTSNLLRHRITRQNRQPKDTRQSIHDVLGDAFKHRFGINFRSNSVFCFPNEKLSYHYGSPCMMLPIGDFQYLWSPFIYDAFNVFDVTNTINMPLAMKNGLVAVNSIEDGSYITPTYLDNIKKLILSGAAKYKQDGLRELLNDTNAKNEVMVYCKDYYLIHTNNPFFAKLMFKH